jgi:DNA repair exonuclease SbcCD ATPase subunit
MLTEHREAVAGIQRIAAQFDTVRADVAETAQRVADLRELIDPVAELVRGVPEARRELATLQALREYVAQKVAALEEQRGLVDRATDRGERLGALLQRLDGEIKEQGQNFKFLAKVKDHVDELRLRHGELLEQAARIGAEHRRLLEEDEAVRRYAGALRSEITEDLERAASRFALERESVDAVSEQVSGLREALADAERRFRPLEEATMTVGELGVEAGRLAERFEEVAREVARLDPEAERVRSLRAEVTEVEADLREVVRRVESVREPSLAAVEQAEQRVEELAQQVAHLEERTSQVEGTAATLHHLGREVERRRVAVEQGLEELARAAVFRDEAHQVAERLAERVATLAAAGAAAEERVAGVERLFGELERRTDRLVVARAEMDAFEEKLAGWRTMESRVGRATAQAADRQALLESLRADVTRLFAVAEEAAAQARIAVDARAEIVAGRTMLDDVLEQLREIRVEASGLDARRERLADEDARLARAEALVLDLRGSLETLAAQREFLDQVVATAGALRFQSRQAEALVEALREAGEAGGSIVSR